METVRGIRWLLLASMLVGLSACPTKRPAPEAESVPAVALPALGDAGVPIAAPSPDVDRQRAELRARFRKEALAPLPAALPKTPWQPRQETLPLIGEGVDDYGYPTRFVDPPLLREMLARRSFNDLTANFEELQTFIETDFKSEMLLVNALNAFQATDPNLPRLLDEWVAAFPGSFAPYAARCANLHELAWRKRGTAYIKDTRDIDLDAMRELEMRADADCRQALAQRPNVGAVWAKRVNIAKSYGFDEPIAASGIAVCPHCFAVRSAYAQTLVPRWGKTFAELDAFVVESMKHVDKNPRLAVLRGFTAWERCQLHRIKDEDAAALAECDQAIAQGNYWAFHDKRAVTRYALKDYAGALIDSEQAVRLFPIDAGAHRTRARALYMSKRPDEAIAAYEEARRLDPSSVDDAELAKALVQAGHERFREGKRDEAIALYERAHALDATNADAVEWKKNATERGKAEDSIAPLRAAYEKDPDRFENVRDLDYALARLRRFDEIVPLWDRYLARHPNDAKALLERAGTYHHLKNAAASARDRNAACALGLAKACRQR